MSSRINELTRLLGCIRRAGTAQQPCFAHPGVYCDGRYHSTAPASSLHNTTCGGRQYETGQAAFHVSQPCTVPGARKYNYYVALSLSVFLGAGCGVCERR